MLVRWLNVPVIKDIFKVNYFFLKERNPQKKTNFKFLIPFERNESRSIFLKYFLFILMCFKNCVRIYCYCRIKITKVIFLSY